MGPLTEWGHLLNEPLVNGIIGKWGLLAVCIIGEWEHWLNDEWVIGGWGTMLSDVLHRLRSTYFNSFAIVCFIAFSILCYLCVEWNIKRRFQSAVRLHGRCNGDRSLLHY